MLETAWESRWMPDYGGIAQLGEHLPCKQGVASSKLAVYTEVRKNFDPYLENRILKNNLKYQISKPARAKRFKQKEIGKY